MTHEFHNPDNLTPEQIGEGYRLLLKSEIKPRPENREINAWLGRFRRWTDHNDSMCVGSSQDLTYRVPLSTWPLPGSKWQAEREALSRGECVEAQLASDWAPARLGPSVSLPPIETFSAAMESVTKQESPPTDNDSWECLLRTNAQLGKKVVELEKDSDFWKSRYEDAINATSFIQEEKESLGLLVGQVTVTDGILALRRQRNELQSKLTAAQARLEQLEWRPVSVKPTKEDADIHGHVLICRKDGDTGFGSIYVAWTPEVTHWRPAALPTIPDQSRVEFEKWWKSNGVSGFLEEAAFDLWNAARKEEKV